MVVKEALVRRKGEEREKGGSGFGKRASVLFTPGLDFSTCRSSQRLLIRTFDDHSTPKGKVIITLQYK